MNLKSCPIPSPAILVECLSYVAQKHQGPDDDNPDPTHHFMMWVPIPEGIDVDSEDDLNQALSDEIKLAQFKLQHPVLWAELKAELESVSGEFKPEELMMDVQLQPVQSAITGPKFFITH